MSISQQHARLDLGPLLSPQSIALIGISDRSYFASNLLRAIEGAGYSGRIYPVNPKRATVFGRQCYPSFAQLPERPDLAILLVPSGAVQNVIEEGQQSGTRAFVVIASGFGESPDPEGRAREEALARFSAEHGLAICGPNCNGLISVRERLPCYVGPLYQFPIAGNIGLVSQSGATIGSIVTEATDRNLGFTYLISSGNETAVDVVDYLEFFLRDPNTKVLALFLETLRRPIAFLDVARRAAEVQKPIVALKIGRSAIGRQSALAHTGSLAGSDEAFEAACRHWGIIRADDIGDMLDKCHLLSQLEPDRWPKGNRLAFLSVSGGGAGLLADLADRARIALPPLSEATVADFAANSPPHVTVKNPLDFTGQIHAYQDLFDRYIWGLAKDPNVDSIGVLLHCEQDYERYLTRMAQIGGQLTKPLVLTATEATAVSDWGRAFLESHDLPVVLGLGRFVTALSAAARYRRFLDTHSSFQSLPRQSSRLVAVPDHEGLLPDLETYRILQDYGLPTAPMAFAYSVDYAVTAARQLGFPVAIKAVVPGLGHKTDIGGVRLGLRDPEELAKAHDEMSKQIKARNGLKPTGVIVQAMITDAIEGYIGAVRTDEFGPIVVAGLGGIFVEILKDVSMRLAPVDLVRAEEMIDELAGSRVFDGIRGQPPADRAAFAQLVVQVSQLASDLGDRLAEIDLNPVMVKREGQGVQIVDALIALRPKVG